VRVVLDGQWRWSPSADLTRPLVRPPEQGVPRGEPVGGSLSDEDLLRWEALALALVSADAVGVMTTALARAVDYARERVQYGVPIGSFQAVQHLCAEAHVLCVGAGAATRYAAWAVDVLEAPEALRAARVAKAHSGAAGVQVAEVSMQVHGGIGQTWEHICHFYARRALLDARVLGDPDLHLGHLADAMRTTH
jgi:alkylation response protein AidB-like acyl-CoA dehydrogenase